RDQGGSGEPHLAPVLVEADEARGGGVHRGLRLERPAWRPVRLVRDVSVDGCEVDSVAIIVELVAFADAVLHSAESRSGPTGKSHFRRCRVTHSGAFPR